MKVKSFYGENVPEILQRVKAEMGGEAIIVQTRSYRQGGLLGLFRRPMVEVIAAANEQRNSGAADPAPAPAGENKASEMIERFSSLLDGRSRAPRVVYPHHLEDLFRTLLANGMEEALAREVIDRTMHRVSQSLWEDDGAVRSGAAEIIAGSVTIAEEIGSGEQERIALIGPTGVGKTTTIAKLAAIAAVLRNRRIALITIDTFRVAAVDQLRNYADIISVPLEVAHTPRELKEMLAKHSDKDLVLVDTAGRSPYNKLQLAENKGFLGSCPELKIYLVLSLATNQQDLREIIVRFNQFAIEKLIFTKFDETQCCGTLFNVLHDTRKELAYITTGQDVPNDIEVPTPAKLAYLVTRRER